VRYATPETVYRLLEVDPDTEDTQLLDILDGIEEGIAQPIDLYTGRTFGSAPVAETRDIAYRTNPENPQFYTDRVYIPESGMYFFTNSLIALDGTQLTPYVTPSGMKNVTGVIVDGTWDGTVWDDEEVIADEDWRLVFTSYSGWSYGIVLPTTGYQSVRVTAEWEDLSYGADVPPLVRESATELVVDEYRIRTQSPTGELGPPGLVTYIRNIWEHTPVKMALDGLKIQRVVI
jgi:hypothetical protein